MKVARRLVEIRFEINCRKHHMSTQRIILKPEGESLGDEFPSVPADAIAALSGVNMGSVVKVLAAITALAEHLRPNSTAAQAVMRALLSDYTKAPGTPPFGRDGHGANGRERADNVAAILGSVLRSGIVTAYPALDTAALRIRLRNTDDY